MKTLMHTQIVQVAYTYKKPHINPKSVVRHPNLDKILNTLLEMKAQMFVHFFHYPKVNIRSCIVKIH